MKNKSLHNVMLSVAFGLLLSSPAHAAQLNKTSTLIDETPPQMVPDPSPAFDTVIEDLPLAPGLHVKPDEDVLFVVPRSGRIVETTMEGEVDVDAAYQFYQSSLPPLGWKALDIRTYQRGSDILHVDAKANEKTTTVVFSVTPMTEK